MSRPEEPAPSGKAELYEQLADRLSTLLAGEVDFIANAANTAALVHQSLPDVNWVGFYVHQDGELVLGPFQGKPACGRIPVGRGVCGTSADRRRTLVVEDVHEFPGHIACDPASWSEIVVPLIADGRLIGVLDLDSPLPARFDADDEVGLERLVGVFLRHTSLTP